MKFLSVEHVVMILEYQLYQFQCLKREAIKENSTLLEAEIELKIAFLEKLIKQIPEYGLEVA